MGSLSFTEVVMMGESSLPTPNFTPGSPPMVVLVEVQSKPEVAAIGACVQGELHWVQVQGPGCRDGTRSQEQLHPLQKPEGMKGTHSSGHLPSPTTS